MGAWRLAAVGGLYFFIAIESCGGSEFSSDGEKNDASADVTAVGGTSGAAGTASGGSAGAAGSGGNGGAAGMVTVDANDCTNELYQLGCNDVSTGDPTCDTCGRAQCCNEADTCLQNTYCAEALGCYLRNCWGQPGGTACLIANCQQCALGAATPFGNLSTCLQNHCKLECPGLQP